MPEGRGNRRSRRAVLLAAGTAMAGLAGCGGDGGTETYGDWFKNVDNYDAELDRTGRDRVSVTVGAGDGFAFAPAAIRVDRGTTVVWTWNGRGGRHNVVAEDGSFRSPYHREAGATFEHTVESAGLYPSFCKPHRQLGMKGGIRVE